MSAMILLNLAKVRKQAASGCCHLLEAVLDLRRIHEVDASSSDLENLGVDRGPTLHEICDACIRVDLRSFGYLAQQVEDGLQSRLGPNELTLFEARQPGDGLSRRGRDVADIVLAGVARRAGDS